MAERSKKTFLRRNSLLIHVLGPCAIILLLTMTLCLVEYRYTYDIARDNTIDSQRATLNSVAAQLDHVIYSMDALVGTVNSSKAIGEKIRTSVKSGQAYDAQQVASSLPTLQMDGKLAGNYFIYIDSTGQLYAPKRTIMEPARYYGSFFGDEERSFDQWMGDMFANPEYGVVLPAQTVLVEGLPEEVLFYMCPYMDNVTMLRRGSFMFYIYADGLRQLLSPCLATGAEVVYLTGPQGQLLACFGSGAQTIKNPEMYILDGNDALHTSVNHTVQGRRMLYSQARLQYGGVTITIVTPVEVFEHQVVHSLLVMLMLILGTIVAVGVVMAHYILSNQQPLAQLSDNLADQQGGRASFIRLNEAFLQIRGDFDQVSQQLKKHRDALLETLVSEKRIDNQVYSLLSEHIENPYGTEVFFRGVYIHTSGLDSMDSDRLLEIITCTVEDGDATLKVLSRRSESMVALMHLSDTEETALLQEQLLRLNESLQRTCGIRSRFWVGPVSSSLQQLCYSFSAAWSLAEQSEGSDTPVVMICEETTWPQYFLLRDSDENKLVAYCQEGDGAGVTRCLDEIYQENFVRRELPPGIRTLLYARLADLLMKCAGDTAPGVSEMEHLLTMKPREAFCWLQERFCLAALENTRRREADTQELNRQIVEHIQLNFRDPELCLTSIASVFGMTESYLSVLIKHTLNQNYSTYLNDLRIRYASSLLAEGRYTVEQIAEMSGYTNAASFRRAYKRTMGYSPSAHAEHSKKDTP